MDQLEQKSHLSGFQVYTYGALLRSADANAAKELLEEMKQRGTRESFWITRFSGVFAVSFR